MKKNNVIRLMLLFIILLMSKKMFGINVYAHYGNEHYQRTLGYDYFRTISKMPKDAMEQGKALDGWPRFEQFPSHYNYEDKDNKPEVQTLLYINGEMYGDCYSMFDVNEYYTNHIANLSGEDKIELFIVSDEPFYLTKRPPNIQTKIGPDKNSATGNFVFKRYVQRYSNNKSNYPDAMVFEYTPSYGDFAMPYYVKGLSKGTPDSFAKALDLKTDLLDYCKNEIGMTTALPYGLDKVLKFMVDHLRVDCVPPEITEVSYDIIRGYGSKSSENYLNEGDTLEINVTIGGLTEMLKYKEYSDIEPEKIKIDKSSYFPIIINGVEKKATIYHKYNWDTYWNNDVIKYRYTVGSGDEDIDGITHNITASPTNKSLYESQIESLAKKMGIADEVGNWARMTRVGNGAYMPFPQITYGSNKDIIIVDATSPEVTINLPSDALTYKQSHDFEMIPFEKGSMLKDDKFYYAFSKSAVQSTSSFNHTGKGEVPFTKNTQVDDIKNWTINNDLYIGKSGYTQYDDKYNSITGQVIYDNVNYIDGSASDVLINGKRQISGDFYVHTFIKDKAGNEKYQTAGPLKLDNTPLDIDVTPGGRSSYGNQLDITFSLKQPDEHSGFDYYEYKWLSKLDYGVNLPNADDRYTSGTYTNSEMIDPVGWTKVTSLDGSNEDVFSSPNKDDLQEGAYYLIVRAFDKAGNKTYFVSEKYMFDVIPPDVTITSLSPNGEFTTPLENHDIKIQVNDKHNLLDKYMYYFSNVQRKDNENLPGSEIWEKLDMSYPTPDGISEDVIKEAIINTSNWKKETLNGYVYLYVYASDIVGNEIIKEQRILLDNGGNPVAAFDYDNAISNEFSEVTGHIVLYDDSGIEKVEYAFTDSTVTPTTYQTLDITGISNKSDFTIDTPVFTDKGDWYLHVKVTDVHGNITVEHSNKYIILDAPEVTAFSIDVTETVYTNRSSVPLTITNSTSDNREYSYKVYDSNEYSNVVQTGDIESATQIVDLTLKTDTNVPQNFYFKFFDKLGQTDGNVITVEAVYDDEAPTASISYSSISADGKITATLENIADNVTAINDININQTEFEFDVVNENSFTGEFEFILVDEAGNKKSYIARVEDNFTDDANVVRVVTDNVVDEKYQRITIDLTAQKPTVDGYQDIVDPDLSYQLTGDSNAIAEDDTNWITYSSNISLDDTSIDGTYYLHTRLVVEGDVKTQVFGPFVLDNTVPIATISYTYVDENGETQVVSQTEYETLTELIAPVTVTITFDEIPENVRYTDESNTPLTIDPLTFNDNKTVKVIFSDEAGNQGEEVITIDNITTPFVSDNVITISPANITNEDVTITVAVDTAMYTIDDITFDGTSPGTTNGDYIVTHNGTVVVSVHETAEPANVLIYTFDITNIDKVDPIGVITIKDIDNVTKKASISITDDNQVSMTGVTFTKEDDTVHTFTVGTSSSIDGVVYNGNTHTVTSTINGTVSYTYEDSAMNTGTSTYLINTIDKNLNMAGVTATYTVDGVVYNNLSDFTVVNDDILVTLILPSGHYLVNNGGKLTRNFASATVYDFLISNGHTIGKFNVDLTDKINKGGLTLGFTYTIDGVSDTNLSNLLTRGKTNKDIKLLVTGTNLSKVVIDGTTYTSAPFEYIFSKNKIIEITGTDTAGNVSTVKLGIDAIDKSPTKAGLFSLYSRPTQESAITLQFLATKPVTITEIKKGNSAFSALPSEDVTKYQFDISENDTYSVTYRDELGNEKTETLIVNNFDYFIPTLRVLYNGQTSPPKINEDILVTVEATSNEPYGVTVLNTVGGMNEYLFTSNGEFTFRVADYAGNIGEITAKVDSIDRTPPEYTVEYSTTDLTKNPVEATVTFADNDVIIESNITGLNEVTKTGNKVVVTFTRNGYYILKVKDQAGNKAQVTLMVKNIDTIDPTITFDRDYIVTKKNELPNLDDYSAFDSHSGNLDKGVTITNADVSTEGISIVTYEVTDEAGNTVRVNREILVVGDEFTIVVDGQILTADYISNNKMTDIQIYNLMENCQFKKLTGVVKLGAFKEAAIVETFYDTNDDKKPGSDVTKYGADETGWQTLYFMDQNRNTKTVNVYFKKSKN